MRDASDNATLDLETGQVRRQRGRPRSEDTRTAAERKADSRRNLAAKGVKPITVNLPQDLIDAIAAKTVFGVTTQAQVIERILRNQLLRKR